MSRKVTVQGYESFRYRELWRITQWKDGCIYKTKSVGFIKATDEARIDKFLFTTSSLPTKLTIQPEFTIDVLTEEELFG